MIMKNNEYKNSMLALAASSVLLAGSASAAEFYLGEDDDIAIQITSQLSIGASWRHGKRDPALVSHIHGGTGVSNTTDDGNLNFQRGKTFSKIIKGVHDISISKDNFGGMFRVKYWYDKELDKENRAHGHINNSYAANTPLSDEGFVDNSKFSGIELLDAYVYGDFDFGDVPVGIRLGRQVISWGESTFIQGGINSTNPLDVSALRRPGAQLKEGLLPVGMVSFNAGITEELSIEGYYQYEWVQTQVDPCGTFFSGADFVADGCNGIPIGESYGYTDAMALAVGVSPDRIANGETDDGGQYGVAFRYYAPELNDTEFGIYYLNYHSRLPMIVGVRSNWVNFLPTTPFIPWASAAQAYGGFMADPTNPAYALGGLLQALGLASPTTGVSRAGIDGMNPQYGMVFPEDLNLFGLSFATNVGGVALSGEISIKPDTPVQLNGNHLLAGAIGEGPVPFTQRVQTASSGETIRGFDYFDVTQIQLSAVQFFDRVLGASRLTLVAEAGMTMTDGVEDMAATGFYYGRSPSFGLTLPGYDPYEAGYDGFVTDSAWGYRLRAQLEYPNAFAGIALKPIFTWSHDVSGYGPEPGSQFQEGRKKFDVSLEASYQQIYTATLSYSNFSGGDYNVMADKDFVSLSFGISY